MCPPQIPMLKPNIQHDGIRSGAFGKRLGPRSRTLMSAISAFIEGTPESSLVLLPSEDIVKGQLSADL